MSAVVAMAENRVIGDGKSLLWKLSEDLKRVKEITMGRPLIMGRKTWDSIGKSLPGRGNIILTRNKDWIGEGTLKAYSFQNAINLAMEWIKDKNIEGEKEIILFGGSEIYKIGLPYCKYIYCTEVGLKPKSKVLFPLINENEWEEKFNSGELLSKDNITFKFLTLERIKSAKKLF